MPFLCKKTAIRRLIGVLSAVLLVWAFLPLVSHVVNVGVAVPAILGSMGVLWGFYPTVDCSKPKGWRKAMLIIIICIICVFAVLAGLFTSWMAVACRRSPEEDATVVVLGAMIVGDAPSRMLRGRLDAAAVYLEAHPQSACVVSGGQGSDETVSEASVMKRYLVACGIDATRIYEEDRSENTYENLTYTMQLIQKEGLSNSVAIATQEFHQYRASVLATRCGASSVGALTCRSPWHLLLCYWVRECAAICRLFLMGY